MEGTLLYPLNNLKENYPHIYQEAVKKYLGRESLLDFHIPGLNCLWNDVLFTASIHPKIVREHASNDGVPFRKFSYYKIEVEKLDQSLLYVYKGTLYGNKGNILGGEFSKFDIKKMEEYSSYPDDLHEYNRLVKEGVIKQFLPYCLITHILYKGLIDISTAEIIID